MEIAVVGVSYKEADVDTRGRVAFTSSLKNIIGEQISANGVSEHIILSTCNRSEIYIASQHIGQGIEGVKAIYKELAGNEILPIVYVKKQHLATQHILEVACGLDSLVIGEDEILSQMKEAVNFAREKGTCKKYLGYLTRKSITFSKKMRNDYKMSENKLSVASIGIQILKEKYLNLVDRKVLLIGTGKMGKLILKYLEYEGVKQIYLTTRSMNHQNTYLGFNHGVKFIEYDQRYSYLNKVDIIISATASPHTVLKKEECGKLSKKITFLDMAVPKDIDTEIADDAYAELYTLDTIQKTVEKHVALRNELAEAIKNQIEAEVKEIELWFLRSKIDHLIQQFHEKQINIIESNRRRLAKMNMTKEQECEMIKMFESSTWEMIKKPIEKLKSLEDKSDIIFYQSFMENLFDLEDYKMQSNLL